MIEEMHKGHWFWYFCKVCNKEFSGIEAMENHKKTEEHLFKLLEK